MSKLVADVETISSNLSSLDSSVEDFSSAVSSFKGASINCQLEEISGILDNYKNIISADLDKLNTSSKSFTDDLVKECCDRYKENEADIQTIDINKIITIMKNVIRTNRGKLGSLTVADVNPNFNSKYYTFNADGVNGNPCVCDPNNNVAYPFNLYANPLICSSYAAGRYWEVNAPDEAFPLDYSWDQYLHYDQSQLGNVYTDPNNPVAYSIVGISSANGYLHDGFIEDVRADGSVVISETNISNGNAYGYQCTEWPSLQAWLDYHNASLVGMYGA